MRTAALDERIVAYVTEHPRAKQAQIWTALKLRSEYEWHKTMRRLRRAGRIKMHGSTGGATYTVVQSDSTSTEDERLRIDAYKRSADYAHAQLETAQQHLASAKAELAAWKELALARGEVVGGWTKRAHSAATVLRCKLGLDPDTGEPL